MPIIPPVAGQWKETEVEGNINTLKNELVDIV